jgi:hypothetical protein
MEPNSIVVVSLVDPKERIWGQLLAITEAGITVRGIAVGSFDEFLRQVKNPEEEPVGLATVFYPMRRVERIAMDEPQGSIPSLAQTFERQVGRSVIEFLNALSES